MALQPLHPKTQEEKVVAEVLARTPVAKKDRAGNIFIDDERIRINNNNTEGAHPDHLVFQDITNAHFRLILFCLLTRTFLGKLS